MRITGLLSVTAYSVKYERRLRRGTCIPKVRLCYLEFRGI
jgi:hypothetical protein